MSEKKSKTAKEISVLLKALASQVEVEVEDHSSLRGLVNQINRKAESVLKPSKPSEAVELSYENGDIVIESTPYLHKSAFGAWRFKLSEAMGQETGTRVNAVGDTVPTYASTFDKDLGKNVLPAACKDALLTIIGSFFPDSPIKEVPAVQA